MRIRYKIEINKFYLHRFILNQILNKIALKNTFVSMSLADAGKKCFWYVLEEITPFFIPKPLFNFKIGYFERDR